MIQPEQEEDLRGGQKLKPRTFINFVSAKERVMTSHAASKAARRGRELLQIIELDKAAYDMFDMPPVREYDMYIRSFGRTNSRQVGLVMSGIV